MKGIVITVGGDVLPFSGDAAELHQAVGGWIEAAPCKREDVTIWCNEDGKGLQLPVNELATVVWVVLGDMGAHFMGDVLVGDVVFTGGPDGQGETTDLGEAARRVIEAALE